MGGALTAGYGYTLLRVGAGFLTVESWSSETVSASHVGLSCPSSTSLPPPPPCAVDSAQSSGELLALVTDLQSQSGTVVVVLTNNISLPLGSSPVMVAGNVTIRSPPGGPLLELDLGLNVDLIIVDCNISSTALFVMQVCVTVSALSCLGCLPAQRTSLDLVWITKDLINFCPMGCFLVYACLLFY